MNEDRTTTIYLDDAVADELLKRAGFKRGSRREYIRPGGREGGKFGDDFYWERDEAVTEAIVMHAEGLGR